ncbi:dystonin isoform X3 [Lutzomyia longipalpis]|uniref:dystonin isoform X3 n=1 Tax=Lutzomyia longipalpis TaxID=7200 RepID=UPI002484363E|nr:dystonin isoform X3 [Lutzomyia longipalpis]
MSTQIYYKDRLGFDPREDVIDNVPRSGHKAKLHDGSPFKEDSPPKRLKDQHGGYEDALTQFKDERDAIQKKTFTKWVNKHLSKAGKRIHDLFEDLRDGRNLLTLLEVLSGENLPREKGNMRFHMLQNAQMALDFLRYKKIKLVNIRAEDIVDGNPKLTLGLIWTIILHFQISDIVVGHDDNLTAKEALMQWARKSTARYPGVKISDFTSSWRDGLAFSAIVHRNRPDILNWREAKASRPRERLETAFHVVEKEYGVTRLLDPEDVDTNEPDEKSLITYISSLYDVFPEPPAMHPLYDTDAQRRMHDYKEAAQEFLYWCKEKTSLLQERVFPASLIELKQLLADLHTFRTEEVAQKHQDLSNLNVIYEQLKKYFEAVTEEEIDVAYRPKALNSAWDRLMRALGDRERQLQQETDRLDSYDRLVDKVFREIKRIDFKLTDIESRIAKESRNLDRVHPIDAKNIVESIETDLRHLEQPLNQVSSDVSVLENSNCPEARELRKEVNKLCQRWSQIRATFHTNMVQKLAGLSYPIQETTVTRQTRTVLETRQVDTNPYFRDLQEYTEWCQNKLKKLLAAEYGTDLATVKSELHKHQQEHKTIDQFHSKIVHAERQKNNFSGDEYSLYVQRLNQLQNLYADLLSTSTKRLSDLDALQDFLVAATNELNWLNEKERIEINRDWADKNLDLSSVHHYYETLMSELETREMQFADIVDRGEKLVSQAHPAAKCIEAHLSALQYKWSWLLQLTLCLEIHLKHASEHHAFFQEVKEAESWLVKQEERLNSKYSQTEFGLDEGEALLRGMQELREEFNNYGDVVQALIQRSHTIVPLHERKQSVLQPKPVHSICSYKQGQVSIDKGQTHTLLDTYGRVKWRVQVRGTEALVPGVCFTLPPPNAKAIEDAERLRKHFDHLIALWQKKQLRLRQNMIFATIKVVKDWDFDQFVAMGPEQRNAIRRALNDDADKLIAEGDPNDPQLRRLRREMDEVNAIFDEFEKRARAEEESKQASQRFLEQCIAIKTNLESLARELEHIISSPLPRDRDSLEYAKRIHGDFEVRLAQEEVPIKRFQETFRNIPLKTPALKKSLDNLLDLWNEINSQSKLHGQRLKLLEEGLMELEINEHVYEEVDADLANFSVVPNRLEELRDVLQRLHKLRSVVSAQQFHIDKMNTAVDQLGRMGVPTKVVGDLKRIHSTVEHFNVKWNNLERKLDARIRECESAQSFMTNLRSSQVKEETWIDGATEELMAMPPPTSAQELDQAIFEKYSVCEDELGKQLEWIGSVEAKLANIGGPSDVEEGIRHQINTLNVIKDEIDSHSRVVVTCLEQVRHISLTGGDAFSAPEVASLERRGNELKMRVDRANEICYKFSKKIIYLRDELVRLRTELSGFSSWLTGARRTLEEKEKSLHQLRIVPSNQDNIRDFVSDVIAHQADLRFITISVQKYFDDKAEFLHYLNDFRTTLPNRLSHVEQIVNSPIEQDLQQVTVQYKELLSRVNHLQDAMQTLGNRHREYNDSVEVAKKWLTEIQPRVDGVLAEPPSSDPVIIQSQMSQTKVLHSEVVSNGRLIDNAQQTLEALVRVLPKNTSSLEIQSLEMPVRNLRDRYEKLKGSLTNRANALEKILIQTQSVQGTLDKLVGLVLQAEEQFKHHWRPASLIKEQLLDQIRENKAFLQTLESHRGSISSFKMSGDVPKVMINKLQEAKVKFEQLHDRAIEHGDFLEKTLGELNKFNNEFGALEKEILNLQENVEGAEFNYLPAEYMNHMQEILNTKQQIEPMFHNCTQLGKDLISKRDVTNTGVVRDQVKHLENLWKNLVVTTTEKSNLYKQKSEHLNTYNKLRDQVRAWLESFEQRINKLSPVSVDHDVIQHQVDETQAIVREHRDYGVTIDKLNDLGAQYDSLIRAEIADKQRTAQSGTAKKISVTSIRRQSIDVQSGRVSETTPIQIQLSEINNRYNMAGVRLSDRQNELESLRDEIRRHRDNMKNLNGFLDKVQKRIPKETIDSNVEAEKCINQCRKILEEMYEKQNLLDSAKVMVKNLAVKKSQSPGVEVLKNELDGVCQRWKVLSDLCKEKIAMSEQLKDFLDTHNNLHGWLLGKERMLTVLGPISSDPRMVKTQVQQVQVLREDFRTQLPQLNHLQNVGKGLQQHFEVKSPEYELVTARLNALQNKWDDLYGQLNERANSLGAAANTTKEFDAGLSRLRESLRQINDNLDTLPYDMDKDELLRKIDNLGRQLEGQRPLLADAEAAAANLCEVLEDPNSRADVNNRVAELAKQYETLQKKLDNRRAEAERALREGRQLAENCARILGWLSGEASGLTDKLLVSAHRPTLQHQIDTHEPVYHEIMAREHEVRMLINRGRDIQDNRVNDPNLQRDLDKISTQWDRVKRDVVDRHTRLQTCMEHCKQYHAGAQNFQNWLRAAEEKLSAIKLGVLKKAQLDHQLKELNVLRSEVWKKSGEYEILKGMGNTFLSACDVDKEPVQGELQSIKSRWEKLNADLNAKNQLFDTYLKKLGDFQDDLRNLDQNTRRCEDRLGAFDALGGASKDPKLIDRISTIIADTESLVKPLKALQADSRNISREVVDVGGNADHLISDVDAIGDRIDDLHAKLGDRFDELKSAALISSQLNERIKGFSVDLSEIEGRVNNLQPPAREIPAVKQQLHEDANLQGRIQDLTEAIGEIHDTVKANYESSFSIDAMQTREQISGFLRTLDKARNQVRVHEDSLHRTLGSLEHFYNVYGSVTTVLKNVDGQIRALKAISSDLEQIRVQHEEFKAFTRKTITPLNNDVVECNQLGQELIRSAHGGVSTQVLEKDLEKLNELWNSIKVKWNERERRIDLGLLQSGKFQEALDGLSKWMADTEEMVANQKPPSADYKVVKAQLQEQKFLTKMLLDRQNSMTSLFNLGQEVIQGCDPAEVNSIQRQLKDLQVRFDNLQNVAQTRTLDLEEAMRMAKKFHEKIVPLSQWLNDAERAVKRMEFVPTDEELIHQRIREHDKLHEEILGKQRDFTELTDIAAQLMNLVGEDEGVILSDKVKNITDRYTGLVDASENIGNVLSASKQGLRNLVLSYQDVVEWMEGVEGKLHQYKVVPVQADAILEQMHNLVEINEDVANHAPQIEAIVDTGAELMKHITSDEALQLKDKLDSLQRRYGDIVNRGSDLLKHTQEALPLVQQFNEAHQRLVEWMQDTENILVATDISEPELFRMEGEIPQMRQVLETINSTGPQLSALSPGEGAVTIESLVARDNRRFDGIVDQIQRRAERLQLSKQRSKEVRNDVDELLEWFRDMEANLRDADAPALDPRIVRTQMSDHRKVNDEISSQRGRVRDALAAGKRVIRDFQPNQADLELKEKLEDLKDLVETVVGLSSDRLSCLDQVLSLSEHFADTHNTLMTWMDDLELKISNLGLPAIRSDQIAIQQDTNERLLQSVLDHKPLLSKQNKTGETLGTLVREEDVEKVYEILEEENARYAALKNELLNRQHALEQAMQESSQFADKIDGMLRALANTSDQVNQAEPISAHPPKIREQIADNKVLKNDLDNRSNAFGIVQKIAADVINKAPNKSDPVVKDISKKLDKLTKLWDDVQTKINKRGNALDDTFKVAQQFWENLKSTMDALKDLQENLKSLEAPAAQPQEIQKQQVALQEIRYDIDKTKPRVEDVRQTGNKLMSLCGEPEKPEVKKHIEDLDRAWDNITVLYAKREENLIDAMEKAMEFYDTLKSVTDFLDEYEEKFRKLGPIGTDVDAVKKQIEQLKTFKNHVDPYMVKIDSLNRQAMELTEKTGTEQAQSIRDLLNGVNRRWETLLHNMVERQKNLEHALLHLGQFQHALNELLVWIERTTDTLDQLKPVLGDPQLIEVELAKLKIVANDIQAHKSSVDTLNDAGRQLIESNKASHEASTTKDKLSTLNRKWSNLLQKASDRQHELEEYLKEAQRYFADVQDMLGYLGDVDAVIGASKPVGGLPETSSEQLQRFMEVFNELEQTRPKVETLLSQGREYVQKQNELKVPSNNLQHVLRTLKQRWDAILARASDKKIKLEIALKEATEFHDALQQFNEWLTKTEKTIQNLGPVSRVLETIQRQMEEHKELQKDVSNHRETMLLLDKKGTHLKYFSQKQDVILIKNLLVSVQHRWERVVAKTSERTRALDHGYKEAQEFYDAWFSLVQYLREADEAINVLTADLATAKKPTNAKKCLERLQEIQRNVSQRQGQYDTVMRNGKQLKERAPKSDEPALTKMLAELKELWTRVCSVLTDRQRKLEETLLLSGQFSEALHALLEWLRKSKAKLSSDTPLYGDLDTVSKLIDAHNALKSELNSRSTQMQSVLKTGRQLEATADTRDISGNLTELQSLWDDVQDLARARSAKLEDAQREAEKLHKNVHMLLEWLGEAEQKLRFASAPNNEAQSLELLRESESFLRELREQEINKRDTLDLAHRILAKAHPEAIPIIKNWITIIESRWDEVLQWARGRKDKLETYLKSLKDLDETIDSLLAWLRSLENRLLELQHEPLPDEIPPLERLIEEHKVFMESIAARQQEVEVVCKPKPTTIQDARKQSRGRLAKSSQSRDQTPEKDRLPHIGPRFLTSSADMQFRSPRAQTLWEQWRIVWQMCWERQKRLHDHLLYLQDVERVKQFSWDEWRKRFLKYNNHKKSRLTDLFRKMDKDNNGLIPRDVFIDGIISTKFPTSRLEMETVADLFDRNGEGLIDWQEFIAALRPDWQERKPATDSDKIHDEVKRLVMLCTCRQKFRVFQVGEGKYRFGDSQKLRLVRILRSTVMVRVGGGWVALDEFLVKNDPCRAKGRTNVELREQFTLADGVSQSMAAFRPRLSTPGAQDSSASSPILSSQGPIMKIRERSQRSVAMSRPTRSSLSASTPDSLSDNESSSGIGRRFSARTTPSLSRTPGSREASKPGSRPSSRPGSKPPSRQGSQLSLDGSDDATPSRIPQRQTPTSSYPRVSRFGGTSTPKSNGTPLLSPSERQPFHLSSTPPRSSVDRLSTASSTKRTTTTASSSQSTTKR